MAAGPKQRIWSVFLNGGNESYRRNRHLFQFMHKYATLVVTRQWVTVAVVPRWFTSQWIAALLHEGDGRFVPMQTLVFASFLFNCDSRESITIWCVCCSSCWQILWEAFYYDKQPRRRQTSDLLESTGIGPSSSTSSSTSCFYITGVGHSWIVLLNSLLFSFSFYSLALKRNNCKLLTALAGRAANAPKCAQKSDSLASQLSYRTSKTKSVKRTAWEPSQVCALYSGCLKF